MLVAPDDGPEPRHERVRLRLAEPIFADAYRVNRATGAAILIDEGTNATVGAVLVTADGDDWP